MDAFIQRWRDELILLARILMMVLFVMSGWGKLTGFQGTVGYMTSTGAPLPMVAAAVAVVMEFGVGIALLIGLWTRPLALLMALFVLGTSFIAHSYWDMQGAMEAANKIQFYKNLSIMGGLFLLAATGPGRYAVQKS
ncbi:MULTISPECIES: DoxX family protein [Ralstonia]|uniref:DoxX family protein n=1 Tax=Ralstonia mojiangensis TaxID=2953895 RepID=A0AAE3I114_9RALS|nr:DoxX family protein [Ralstonia mojiangensis]MCO5410409.1 DoxX family protein [Ralstonia mojiangensis]MCT7294863.1 DoxX family protein [Ralstonia mojiangensis]MCT7313070.1 DoxX family protein [Ralstonia mojiangensis]MCT7315735.1 DoxX family protein [Ralstonia mojiangensis]MCT7324840.1 DoxX family protein [Ralstonia mojiangensis]